MRAMEEKERERERKKKGEEGKQQRLGIDPSKTHSASPLRMNREEEGGRRKRMTYEDTPLERDVSTL